MNVLAPLGIACLFLCGAASVIAGPYDQPWSIVETGTPSEVRREATVGITRIDGVSTRDPRRSEALSPGRHAVTVSYQTARPAVSGSSRDLDLVLEPCTRHRIVARYRTTTAPDWEPSITTERIGECDAKFRKMQEGAR